MGENTAIQWTDDTFNAWHGCTRVSSGCLNCYAEGESKRRGFDVWGKHKPRRKLSDDYWQAPLRWNDKAKAAGQRRLVFCSSMADVFEDHDGPMIDHHGVELPGESVAKERARLFELIDRTPWLVWQLLTKRPENVLQLVSGIPDNGWLGTSTEDQETLEARISHLLAVPAPLHFLSGEPLLGPLDLVDALHDSDCWLRDERHAADPLVACTCSEPREHHVGWVIVGGESGHGARPFDPDWARSIVGQCRAAGVPVFVKQLGSAWAHGHAIRVKGRSKGQDPADWSTELRVRELPDGARDPIAA